MKKGLFIALAATTLFGCGQEDKENRGRFSGDMASLSVAGPTVHDFGQQFVGSSTEHTFTITNVGRATANTMSGAFAFSAYTFKDGPFPGTEGTCSTELLPGESCTVVMIFAPTYAGTFNEHLAISYFNGAQNTSTTSPLINGRGMTP